MRCENIEIITITRAKIEFGLSFKKIGWLRISLGNKKIIIFIKCYQVLIKWLKNFIVIFVLIFVSTKVLSLSK